MKDGTGDLEGQSGNDPEKVLPGPEGISCEDVRYEIMMVVLGEKQSISVEVSNHISRCGPCREWEQDFRRMHSVCGRNVVPDGTGTLTGAAIAAAVPLCVDKKEKISFAKPKSKGDRAALGISLFIAVLLNAALAVALRGNSRLLVPLVSLAAMVGSSFWVNADVRSRDMRGALWIAIQPVTLPFGLVAYLLCREGSSIYCPGCGAAVGSRNIYCSECGTRVQDICCRCGRAVRREFRVCPWCGGLLADCFPAGERSSASCGWSRRQVLFVAAVNASIVASIVATGLSRLSDPLKPALLFHLVSLLPLFDWTALDSRRRSMDTTGWGILVAAAGYAGFLVYLGCRKELVVECPVCGSFPPSNFNFCPCCGSVLNPSCPKCGSAVSPGRFCSHCGASLS